MLPGSEGSDRSKPVPCPWQRVVNKVPVHCQRRVCSRLRVIGSIPNHTLVPLPQLLERDRVQRALACVKQKAFKDCFHLVEKSLSDCWRSVGVLVGPFRPVVAVPAGPKSQNFFRMGIEKCSRFFQVCDCRVLCLAAVQAVPILVRVWGTRPGCVHDPEVDEPYTILQLLRHIQTLRLTCNLRAGKVRG